MEAFDLLKSIRDMLAAEARCVQGLWLASKLAAGVWFDLHPLLQVLGLLSRTWLPANRAITLPLARPLSIAGATTHGRCRSWASCPLCPPSASACSSAHQVRAGAPCLMQAGNAVVACVRCTPAVRRYPDLQCQSSYTPCDPLSLQA